MRPRAFTPLGLRDSPLALCSSLASDAHRDPRRRAGNVKAELDVFVSTSGLRLVKPDGKVLGSFPLQRIQEWSITAPGTFSLSVVNGEKVVGLVIHGDPDEVFAIIDCLERQVAQILEDMRAKEEGREAADVSSPPRRMAPEPDERDPPALEPVAEEDAPSLPPAAGRAFAAEDDAPGEVSEEDLPEDLPQAMSPSEFEDEVVPFRRQQSISGDEPPRGTPEENKNTYEASAAAKASASTWTPSPSPTTSSRWTRSSKSVMWVPNRAPRNTSRVQTRVQTRVPR